MDLFSVFYVFCDIRKGEGLLVCMSVLCRDRAPGAKKWFVCAAWPK